MKKSKSILIVATVFVLSFVLMNLVGCGKVNNEKTAGDENNTQISFGQESKDLYAGSYTGEYGELVIQKYDEAYQIRMYLDLDADEIVTIVGAGYVKHDTLHFIASDNYENEFSGNVEEYGDDYPVRVELHEAETNEYIDELEFERQK